MRRAPPSDLRITNINLQNGAMRGQFKLSGDQRLRLSQQLIDAKVAAGC